MTTELMKRALEFITGVYFGEHEGSRADREKLEADLTTAIQQAEAQQPATGEPIGQAPSVWNSIQIASWIGSQLMREPSMFERNAVCKFVRSLGRHPTLLKHSPKDAHPAPDEPDGYVLVPISDLEDAEESIDDYRNGLEYGVSDTSILDRLGALITAAQAQKGQP